MRLWIDHAVPTTDALSAPTGPGCHSVPGRDEFAPLSGRNALAEIGSGFLPTPAIALPDPPVALCRALSLHPARTPQKW
jgi:hypothetical protein